MLIRRYHQQYTYAGRLAIVYVKIRKISQIRHAALSQLENDNNLFSTICEHRKLLSKPKNSR